MRIIYKITSTNGRWGVQIVGNLAEDQKWSSVMPGNLLPLGKRGGMDCFKYEPDSAGFVVTGGEIEICSKSGAVEICGMYLQSNDFCTLIHASEGAIIQSFGYKRRSSTFYAVTSGEKGEGSLKEVPAGVLLALGLIQPSEDAPPVQEAAPPSSAMSDALRKAGLI